MTEAELLAIERNLALFGAKAMDEELLALVAEVRRLRAIVEGFGVIP